MTGEFVPNKQSRRAFLKLSAAGLTATATAELASAFPASPTAPPAGEVAVHVTSGKMRYAAGESVKWQNAGKASENAIVLNPGKKFQEILGFGAAFTDAACYTFNQLSAPAREELFHELFHPSEMGLNVCRTCIGSSDYSTEVFSYDEGEPDPEMTRFSIAHDEAYVLPHVAAGAERESRFVFVLVAVEPAGVDEGGRIDAGRIDSAALLRAIRAVLREILASLCGGGRTGAGSHGAE
jgi:hypothetical protein